MDIQNKEKLDNTNGCKKGGYSGGYNLLKHLIAL